MLAQVGELSTVAAVELCRTVDCEVQLPFRNLFVTDVKLIWKCDHGTKQKSSRAYWNQMQAKMCRQCGVKKSWAMNAAHCRAETNSNTSRSSTCQTKIQPSVWDKCIANVYES